MLIQNKAKKKLYFNTLLSRIAPTLIKAGISFAKNVLLPFGITATVFTADPEAQK